MELTRRSFLKLCAAAPLAATAPTLLFAETEEKLAPGVRHIGNVRETIERDVRQSVYLVRYDVLYSSGRRINGNLALDRQDGVEARFNNMDELGGVRNQCLQWLNDALKAENVDFSTITPFDKLPKTVKITAG